MFILIYIDTKSSYVTFCTQAEGDFDKAIDTYNNILESAGLTLTGEVHHRIAVMFSKKHNDIHAEEVVYHFEKALESGMDPTVS